MALVVAEYLLIEVDLDVLTQLVDLEVIDEAEEFGEYGRLLVDVGLYLVVELLEEEAQVGEGVDGGEVSLERLDVLLFRGLDELSCDYFEILEFGDFCIEDIAEDLILQEQGH